MTWSTFYDMVAPTTTATGLQATATSGWRTSSQVVTLTPTDAGGSGVQQTVYSVDGVGNVYTGPFTVSGSGSHVVTYSSTDYATNREVTRTGYVNIDVTPPVTLAGGLMEEKEWRNTAATVRLEAGDTQSGVRRTYYELDEVVAPYAGEFTVDRPGSHVVRYWSDDRAGNEERPLVGFVNIDVTAPEVTGATLAPAATAAGWNNSDVTVTIAASDAGGAGVGKRQYAVAGSGVWTDATGGKFTVPAPVDHRNDGIHTFDLRAVDRAGNVSPARTVTVRIDTRAPLTYHSGDDLWHATEVVLSLAADDPGGSGMSGGPAKTEYSRDGGATWTTGTSVLFPLWRRGAGSGVHAVLYRSTDAAGNVEEAREHYVLIDARPPRTTDDAPLVPQVGDVTVHLTAEDTLVGVTACSGVALTRYSLDGGLWADGTVVTVRDAGMHWIAYGSIDVAGNVEPLRWRLVTILP